MLKKILIISIVFFSGIALLLTIKIATHKQEVVVVSVNSIDANQTWELIQSWRTQNNLKPFEKNDKLCKVAETVAYYGNEDKSSLNDKFWDYPYKIGQNASYDSDSPQQILEDWTHSDENKNILSQDWKYSCLVCHNNDCVQIYSNL